MKLKIKLLLMLFLLSCTQKDPAEIVYKGDVLIKKNNNIPNIGYSDVYIESPDGKLVRSLRGNYNNNISNPSIINEKALEEEAKNNKKSNTIYVNNDGTYNTNSKNVKEYYYDEDDKGYHKVVDGENLWTISKLYNMKVIELAELNNLKRPYIIKAGDRLKVIDGNKNKSTNENNYNQTKQTIHIVKSGETLSGIADKYGINSKELAENNNIKYPYTLYVGQKIKLNKNGNYENIKTDDEIHIVKSGDTLSSISIKYNIKQSALIDYNNLKQPYNLHVGQKIKLSNNTKNAKPKENNIKQVKNESPTIATAKPSTLKIENKENSFIWPIQGKIVSLFGSKTNGLYNDGINISANKGEEFKSTEDGIVAYVGNELRGYGTIILIKHSNNWISAYAHCESVLVSKGDKVTKGQVIGTVGETGSVSSPQLYFSLRKGRNAVDPQKYLK